MIKIILFLIGFMVVGGCSDGNSYVEQFVIERDGKPRMITIAEFGDTLTHDLSRITEESINKTLEYAQLGAPVISQALFDARRQLIIDNGGIVNSSVYTYIFKLPIKSVTNIYDLPTRSKDKTIRSHFLTQRCAVPSGKSGFGYNLKPDLTMPTKIEGYYHFDLYLESNRMAQQYSLDQIGDLCIHYEFSRGGTNYGGDAYQITSNTIVIKAQEIKDMLDEVGISYD
ncbi:MAG: hypothetical protein HRU25_15765 [Psychrobium sp.]|nr:hypothetical protein [Psychrobium sp.]